MRRIAMTVTGIAAALMLAPHAAADSPGQAVQLGNIWYPNCVVNPDQVLCIRGSGWPRKIALVSSSGQFQWTDGTSLGSAQPLPLTPGQTYHWVGWTVTASNTNMTFTNDATGHGMTVNDGTANPF